LDKKYQIVLVVGFTVAFAIMSFGFTADIFLWGIIAASIFFAVLLLTYPINQRLSSQNEDSEIVKSEALTDSRICKTMTSFIGIPVFIVFGGLWGKYESMFSVKHGGGAVIILKDAAPGTVISVGFGEFMKTCDLKKGCRCHLNIPSD